MTYSINKNTNKLIHELVNDHKRLNLKITQGPLGSTIIDAGIEISGSIEAGIKISEICLGGLGKVSILPNGNSKDYGWNISVHSSLPVIACLGSQYAGWSLSHDDFFSLCSGPVRSIVQKENIFEELNYKDSSENTSVILEVDKFPPSEIVK